MRVSWFTPEKEKRKAQYSIFDHNEFECNFLFKMLNQIRNLHTYEIHFFVSESSTISFPLLRFTEIQLLNNRTAQFQKAATYTVMKTSSNRRVNFLYTKGCKRIYWQRYELILYTVYLIFRMLCLHKTEEKCDNINCLFLRYGLVNPSLTRFIWKKTSTAESSSRCYATNRHTHMLNQGVNCTT